MKKLFLSSSFKDVADLFMDFAGGDAAGRTVTFIPTAAKHEKVNFYVASGRKALEKRGLLVDELDISTAPHSEISGKLENNGLIYVTGGNTFFLLQELRRTGADGIIKEQIQSGKLYIGESAGSMVLSPNIEYAKGMDDPEAAPALPDFNALHAVDFYPLPHLDSFPFAKTVRNMMAEYATLPLMPISNVQAILVDGESVTVRGVEGKA